MTRGVALNLLEAQNWVVESGVNGTIVGLVGMLGSEIGGLFVAPEAQRCGVGRALVEHAGAAAHSLRRQTWKPRIGCAV